MKYLTREAFVKKFYNTAKQLTAGTGIFPEVMLSQAIIESQGSVNGVMLVGASKLADKYNNYFGIKASKEWKGATVNLKTGEVINNNHVTITDRFRVYPSIEESMRDYVQFLKNNSRYRKAGVFEADTITDQALRLQAAGYATNPSYAELIIQVSHKIKSYLDKLPPNETFKIVISGLTLFFCSIN